MHLHRLTTHNLPSIRVHDQNSMDMTSDHHSSPHSQRSMPREIPIPRNNSPTSSRCGSFHGSLASTTAVPPILPLEPPGSSLPQTNYHSPHYNNHGHRSSKSSNHILRHPSSIDSAGGDESDSEMLRPRTSVLDVRNGGSHGWKLSPIGKSFNDGLGFAGSHNGSSMRSEDSFDRNWREGFFKRSVDQAPPKEFQPHDPLRSMMKQSVGDYDQMVLGKLNTSSSNPPTASSIPFTPFTRQKLTPPSEVHNLSMPEVGSLAPAHWTISPRHLPSRAVSPRTMDSPPPPDMRAHRGPGSESMRLGVKREQLKPPTFSSSLTEFRNKGKPGSLSPRLNESDNRSSVDSRMRRSVSTSTLPGYESFDEDSQMDDQPSHVSQMNRLTLHDVRTPPHRYQRVGSKRRASSPPHEDRMSEPTRKGLLLETVGSDMYSQSRRTPPMHHGVRSSPGAHQKYFQLALPRSNSGSVTSATSISSANTMWSASIGQFSPAPSSLSTTQTDWSPMPSYNSTIETHGMRDYRQSSLSRPGGGRGPHPELSSLGRDNRDIRQNNPAPKMAGMYICECCPKKPKKFDNRSDLQLHELEKQYSCQYCNNRFKNKNEAERHQNSLHLRKHSWSCASLSGNYQAAFHQSTHRPNFSDVCGYCGKEFPLPAQWNARIEHLTAEHKFGECNQSKKFYRADHFRQHLKHSHSGTSGKWTNVLENACMRDEVPPQPINRGSTSSGGGDIGTPDGSE